VKPAVGALLSQVSAAPANGTAPAVAGTAQVRIRRVL